MISKNLRTKENAQAIIQSFKKIAWQDDPLGVVCGYFALTLISFLMAILPFFIALGCFMDVYLIKGNIWDTWNVVFIFVRDTVHFPLQYFTKSDYVFTYDKPQIIVMNGIIMLGPLMRLSARFIFTYSKRRLWVVSMPTASYQALLQLLTPEQVLIAKLLCIPASVKSWGWSMFYGDVVQQIKNHYVIWDEKEKMEFKKINQKAEIALTEGKNLKINITEKTKKLSIL